MRLNPTRSKNWPRPKQQFSLARPQFTLRRIWILVSVICVSLALSDEARVVISNSRLMVEVARNDFAAWLKRREKIRHMRFLQPGGPDTPRVLLQDDHGRLSLHGDGFVVTHDNFVKTDE